MRVIVVQHRLSLLALCKFLLLSWNLACYTLILVYLQCLSWRVRSLPELFACPAPPLQISTANKLSLTTFAFVWTFPWSLRLSFRSLMKIKLHIRLTVPLVLMPIWTCQKVQHSPRTNYHLSCLFLTADLLLRTNNLEATDIWIATKTK